MTRSAIYTVNPGSAVVASGGTIPTGNVVRRFGCNCTTDGTSITLKGQGYYEINATFSFTPSTNDTYTIQAYLNGSPVQGAKAVVNTDVAETVPVNGIVRLFCCQPATLTFVLTTAATGTATPTNVAVTVEKL